MFVPDHRVLPVRNAVAGNYPREHNDIPRYRSALFPTLATYMIAPYLAAFRSAFRITYGAGFIYDRNFAYDRNVFGGSGL